MRLEGDNARLVLADATHADVLRGWFNDEDTLRQIAILGMPASSKWEREYIDSNGSEDHVLFMIDVVEHGLIGVCGLHAINFAERTARTVTIIGEAGFRGNGIGTLARRRILGFAFGELDIARVSGSALACNGPAISLLRKTSDRIEGFRHEAVLKQGHRHDVVDFGTLNPGMRWRADAPKLEALLVDCSCIRMELKHTDENAAART